MTIFVIVIDFLTNEAKNLKRLFVYSDGIRVLRKVKRKRDLTNSGYYLQTG
jgi:hypothetical protein